MAIILLFLLIYPSLMRNAVSARAVSGLTFLSSSTANTPLPESSTSFENQKSSDTNTEINSRSYHSMVSSDDDDERPYISLQAPSQVTFPHNSFKSPAPDNEDDELPPPSSKDNIPQQQPVIARHPYDHYRSLRTMQRYHSRILGKRFFYHPQPVDDLSTAWNWFIVISVIISFFFTVWVVWGCERREADAEYVAINRGNLRGSMVRGRRLQRYYGSISTNSTSDSSSDEYTYPQHPYNDLPYPAATAPLDPELGDICRGNSGRSSSWSWFSFARRKESPHYSPKNMSTESFKTASSHPASISKGKGREGGPASEGVRRASGNDMYNRLETLDGSNHDQDPAPSHSLPHQRTCKHVSFTD